MKFILILTTFILVGALALTHEDDFVPEVDAIDTMEGEDVALGDERSYLLQSGKKKKTVKSVSIGKLSDYADKQDKNAVKPSFSAKLDAEIQAAKKAAKQATTSFVAADEAASVHAEKCTTEPEKFCNNAGNGGARTFKPLKLSACKMMCMGLKDCTTGYWDKGGGGICRLFGVPGAKKKKCKIDARRSTDYTVIKCAKGGGAAKKKAAKKKAPVKKKAPTKKAPAPKKKKKAAAPKKKSSSSSKKSGAVYVTTKIIFGKNKAFKGWLYKNICPIAAQNMLKCHRCPQKDGNCLEFFKFRNQASFDRYQKLKWLPKPFMTRFVNSGTTTTGYKKISKAQYEAGRKGSTCEKVNPPPVYATTRITFGKNIKGFKTWMYKNICPIAAQNMRACHRCPQKDGTCLEFFKFRNRASYVRYQSLSWLPKKHLRKFMDSGSSTTGYEEINQADYEAGKRGKGCEKVKPAAKKKKSKKSGPVYVTTKIVFGKNTCPTFKPWMYNNICPLAAQNMVKCHRCPQKDGNCLEFFKFRNQASFDRYQKLKWLPKPFLTKFINSGTTTTGYKKISKAQYEAGRLGASCEQVNQPPVYATTTVNFGTNIKGFKKWMYKNICPIAAQNMRACHRCPQKGGACREFFKFRNRASFERYQTLSWLPKSHLDKFMQSGSTTTGYEEISHADYEAGKKGKGCEKVAPASE